ncbi:MAG TPA: ATP-binding protein [Planctomycetaceae bacterium]|nr:ATP-binding protein [Planctomycetaceae bacterium]
MSHPPADDAARADRWKSQYEEIASLAGGLAHEIRNPLSTIRLNLELLSEDLGMGEAARDQRLRRKVDTVQRECQHLERILEDFLEFARAHALRTSRVQLNDEVRQFLDFFQPQAADCGVELSPHFAGQLPDVELDTRLFQQVLLNLSRNALQAMPDGGRLEFLTCERDGRVLLEIIDNGCGMDQPTQDRMFDTFFSTKTGGSGLGLPTVRRIIEAHGGEITCESAVRKGTRFRIALPAAPHQADE